MAGEKASHRTVYYAKGVDFKTVAVTPLIPVKTGYIARVISAHAIGRTRTGSGTGPALRIGVSSTYGSVFNTETPVTAAVLEQIDLLALAAVDVSALSAFDLGTAIGLKVNAASTYTTHTGDVLLVVDLIPA